MVACRGRKVLDKPKTKGNGSQASGISTDTCLLLDRPIDTRLPSWLGRLKLIPSLPHIATSFFFSRRTALLAPFSLASRTAESLAADLSLYSSAVWYLARLAISPFARLLHCSRVVWRTSQ